MTKPISALLGIILFAHSLTLFSQTLNWQHCGDMPDNRRNHASCYLDGKVYLAGGYNHLTQRQKTLWSYDPNSDSWEVKAPMQFTRSNLGLVACKGKVYAVGGDPFRSTIECFDPDSNAWEKMANMPTGRQHLACAATSNRIYAIGGTKLGHVYSKANEVYNPDSNTWESKAELPENRELFTAAACSGRIYVFGGTDGYNLYSTTYCYDPANDTWSSLADMPTGRFGHASAVDGHLIYVLGGGDNFGDPVLQVDVYNTFTDSWQTVDSLLVCRKLCGAAFGDGYLYATGGSDLNYNPTKSLERASPINTSIQQFNPDIFSVENTYYQDGAFHGELILKHNHELRVELLDMKGKVCYQEESYFTEGKSKLKASCPLTPGLYLLRISNAEQQHVRKFLVM